MTCPEPDPPCQRLNAIAMAKGWPMRCACDTPCERGELNDLRALWQRVGQGGVPARAGIDIRMLKPYARNVAILEQVETAGGHSYRFRLFGSALAMRFGEHTGHVLEDVVQPMMLSGWVAFYDTVLRCRRPIRLNTHFRLPSNGYLKGEILAMPLLDAQGAARLVMAATYVDVSNYAPAPFSPLAQTA